MKKIVFSLFLLFAGMTAQCASIQPDFPDEVSVHEHWISLTKSYDIETKTQRLGTLYRRFFSFLLTYDFYDPMNVKTATASARFFSFGAHLDIHDLTDRYLGSVEEKIFTFFPTFEVFGPDSSSKLARAEMNFWGTKFYIYDPATNREMALMTRPFFRFKNDWTIHVTDRRLLEQKQIDPRVLMTVVAVQGEIEDWQRDHINNNSLKRSQETSSSTTADTDYKVLMQQISTLSAALGVDKDAPIQQNNLEALAQSLDNAFNAEHVSNNADMQSNEARVNEFTKYCLNKVASPALSEQEKKDILTLLNLRLQGHN